MTVAYSYLMYSWLAYLYQHYGQSIVTHEAGTVVPPYVGMTGKQYGVYHSVQTLIFHLDSGGEFYTSKDTWICSLGLLHLYSNNEIAGNCY